MIEKQVVVGPFQCNCHILVCEKTGHGFIVDPGDESQEIFSVIEKMQKQLNFPIQIQALLHTHAHLDHIGATRAVKEALKVPEIFLHASDLDLYKNLKQQGMLFGLDYFDDPLNVDQYLEDDQILKFGSLQLQVIHTPGHSPGSVCFCLKENSEAGVSEKLFTGDTLFKQSIGRTDLWLGDGDLLLKSIKQRILTLDDDIPICPGHGPGSLIGLERRENPFLQ